MLSGCKGTQNIIIWGSSLDEHNKHLDEVLTWIEEHRLKINSNKYIFDATSLIFSGHKLSAYGKGADPKKVVDISKFGPLTSAAEVKSFLDILDYCSHFISHFFTITTPLQQLTRKNTVFKWTFQHQNAFDQLKTILTSSNLLAYYNPATNTELIIGASPHRLSAILAQEQTDGQYKPVRCASCSLDKTATRYSQTEREAFATSLACEHSHYYIYNKQFTIKTDHKPLEKLLSAKSYSPPNIQRWMLYLQTIQYMQYHEQ